MRSLAAIATLAWSVGVAGQCTNTWPTVPGSSGVEGSVRDTLLYDPDGPGPIAERVLVSGSFKVAGNVLAENLAFYDPATRTWSAFGAGPFPPNLELADAGGGNLFVGGAFSSVAGVPADNVAHFDGVNWSPIAGGVDAQVTVAEVLSNGDLVVGGNFATAGTIPTNRLAKWDGSAWSAVNSTSLGAVYVQALAEHANGNLIASLISVGDRLVQFDGTSWSPIGPNLPQPPADVLLTSAGELFACGQAQYAGETVGRWNGSNWVGLPNTPFQHVRHLRKLPNGLLLAVGRAPNQISDVLATWDGFAWSPLTSIVGAVENVSVLASGDYFVGGSFRFAGGATAANVALWNGASWAAASVGMSADIHFLAARPDGSLFAGLRSSAPGAGLVYRWTGSSWVSIGGGFSLGVGSYPSMRGLFALPDGELISCGDSSFALPSSPIAQRWDGSSWATIATTSNGRAEHAAQLANGDLVLSGSFSEIDGVQMSNIGRFDGTSWMSLGGGLPLSPSALLPLPNGDLLALVLTSVMRWDGTAWTQLGLSPAGTAHALELGVDGNPILAGSFLGGDVLRWNGSSWGAIGTGPAGPVRSLAVHANGDLIASPLVSPVFPARPVERWDGVAWTPVGGLVDGDVLATEVGVTGDVLLGGTFVIAGGEPRCRFARIATSCPATAQSLASNCALGPIQPELHVGTLPWLGATARNRASSLGNASLAVVVTGLAQVATPLQSVIPAATPGCTLLAAPDVLQLAVPDGDEFVTEFAIPNLPSVLAATYLQQVVTVHLDAAGDVVDSLSTNTLLLQVGAF